MNNHFLLCMISLMISALLVSAEATLDERINSLESQVKILTSKLEEFQESSDIKPA